MNRTEHLQFCSICKHQKEDMRKGILCGLTGGIADFEETCSSFAEDPEILEQIRLKEIKDALDYKMAGMGKRFLNYLLDLVFVLIFIFIFSILFGVVIASVDRSIISDIHENSKLIGYLITYIVYMIYYIVFEATTGRSIAKYITGTEVVTENGEKPGFLIIVVRTLCRFIPIEAFSIFFNDGSAWHDTITGTKVINV